MKHLAMTQPKARKPAETPKKAQKADAAFDIWLQRGLHQIYDEVAREPLPDELLRLIEEDRKR
jgi:hypothetical protein